MEFNYKYKGSSKVQNSSGLTGMTFVPDAKREPTFFKGLLHKKLPFREAISALHHIVVSDYRYQPKDKTQYLEWAKGQEDIWWAEAMEGAEDIKMELKIKRKELDQLNRTSREIMAPFWKARMEFRQYAWKRDPDLARVLDPVISVHPDELFFECFSQDESSYGKLSCNYNVFKDLGEFKCGTTNIDYSVPLFNEFQKIRNYKETSFEIDPSGFEIQTTKEESFKEVKIDLPDSWIRGFLQVSSAMTMQSYQFDLDPIDMANILLFLKRNKEKKGPRSIRWVLKKGEPVKAIFEPWNKVMNCRASIYNGHDDGEIRMWGRRRLALLERLLPVAKNVKITLLGTGLPSFFEVDLIDMVFTLGLSGWTSNDWSRSSNFDLMTPRLETDGITQQKVYLALKENWYSSAVTLSTKLGLSEAVIESALTNFIQEGKVVYDMYNGVYRLRELTKDPLPIDKLRYKNEREKEAAQIIRAKTFQYKSYEVLEGAIKHRGVVKENKDINVEIVISDDEKLVEGKCDCRFYYQNKLYKGPCAHMMTLRKAATIRLEKKLNV